jgi:malate synthase
MLEELETLMKVPKNSFKVCVIVESIYVILELEEIIFAMKHRIVGLNTGRWNYMATILASYHQDITSLIKPRMKITVDEPFLDAFNRHVVHLAHKRGIHAIGGASNYIPRSNSSKATEYAKKYVIDEKFKEAS